MALAFRVLNCQLMVAPAALRSLTRAGTSRRSASSSGSRCLRQERDSTLNSISAMFSQLPCLGVWWNSSRLATRPGLWRWKGLVQRRRAVGVQVVQHHSHHRDIGIGFVHQLAHPVGEVLHRAPLGHRHMAPPRQGFAGQEQIAGPLPPVLIVLPPRASRLGRHRRPRIGQQLGWRSRQSRPPASGGHRVRRTEPAPYWIRGPAPPPCGPRSRRSPWGCTTLSSATA